MDIFELHNIRTLFKADNAFNIILGSAKLGKFEKRCLNTLACVWYILITLKFSIEQLSDMKNYYRSFVNLCKSYLTILTGAAERIYNLSNIWKTVFNKYI